MEIVLYLVIFLGGLEIGRRLTWRLVNEAEKRAQRAEERGEIAARGAASARDAAEQIATAAEAAMLETRSLREVTRGILTERDDWRKLYQQHALEHGAAQNMLMVERANLARQVAQLGGKPRLNQKIDEAVSEFQRLHIEPLQKGADPGDSAGKSLPEASAGKAL